ncbi:MAG: TIGR00730 family Rossman fold protein [Bacteroidota bacterium]
MLQICVYCASSDKIDPKYFQAADELAGELVQAGAQVIYGGGAKGLMGKLADGVLARNGTIIGVIPEFMKAVEWDHPRATEMRVVPDMHTRKRAFLEGTDGIVALPGGCGTFEELLEAITWKRLGLVTCPIIVVNTEGYYDPLIQMLERSVAENFMRAEHLQMWSVVERPDQVMQALQDAPGWDRNAIGFAAV